MPWMRPLILCVCVFFSLVALSQEEVAVFYRGVHWGLDRENPLPLEYRQETCKSGAASTEDMDEKACLEIGAKVQLLSHNRSKNRYFSDLDWIIEAYVNNHAGFLTALAHKESDLSVALSEVGLTSSGCPLLSTSINILHPLKYAGGLHAEAAKRRIPNFKEGRWQNTKVGYVDVFIIPHSELAALNPLDVSMKNSAEVGITVKSWKSSVSYLHQQEVIFPGCIPARYHATRVVVDLAHLPSIANHKNNCGFNEIKNQDLAIENYFRYTLADNIDTSINKFLAQRSQKPVYMSPYGLQAGVIDKPLSKDGYVNLRDKIWILSYATPERGYLLDDWLKIYGARLYFSRKSGGLIFGFSSVDPQVQHLPRVLEGWGLNAISFAAAKRRFLLDSAEWKVTANAIVLCCYWNMPSLAFLALNKSTRYRGTPLTIDLTGQLLHKVEKDKLTAYNETITIVDYDEVVNHAWSESLSSLAKEQAEERNMLEAEFQRELGE